MKTTIIPAINTNLKKTGSTVRFIWALNLVLAISYIFTIIILATSPTHHGHGGTSAGLGVGINTGMGNAANLSLTAVYILLSFLIMVHLISLIYVHLPWHMIMIVGLGMIIFSTLTLGLLIFVRQYANLLQSVHPIPQLIFVSLAFSLFLGTYSVIDLVRNRPIIQPIENPLPYSTFPLSTNRYRNVHVLGEGGVGTIWYAERIEDGLPVVVKVPRKWDENTGIAFMQEMSVWKELEHQNIATVLSANILPVPYIEIEYLPSTLEDLKKPLPISQALLIIKSLVSALSYAHNRGVAHCDIKPSNILIKNDAVPKLTDWGLARSGSLRWSVSGFSPKYAAPEQRQPTPGCGYSTDIWQIGMVLAELITGEARIPTGNEQIFLISDNYFIFKIIQKCLASDPKDRYQSANALLEDLDKRYIQ